MFCANADVLISANQSSRDYLKSPVSISLWKKESHLKRKCNTYYPCNSIILHTVRWRIFYDLKLVILNEVWTNWDDDNILTFFDKFHYMTSYRCVVKFVTWEIHVWSLQESHKSHHDHWTLALMASTETNIHTSFTTGAAYDVS